MSLVVARRGDEGRVIGGDHGDPTLGQMGLQPCQLLTAVARGCPYLEGFAYFEKEAAGVSIEQSHCMKDDQIQNRVEIFGFVDLCNCVDELAIATTQCIQAEIFEDSDTAEVFSLL